MVFGIGTAQKAENQAAKETGKANEAVEKDAKGLVDGVSGEEKENQKTKEELGSKKENNSMKELAKEVKEAAGAFGKQAKEEKGAGTPAKNAKAPEKDLAIG